MLQINIPLSHALTRIEKHAEHQPMVKKSRISAIRKNVLSGQSLALAMKNSGYDFPSKSCVNNLLLNSGRTVLPEYGAYTDRWLEEAKKSVRKAALLLLLCQVCWYFSSSSIMVSAICGISDMLSSKHSILYIFPSIKFCFTNLRS